MATALGRYVMGGSVVLAVWMAAGVTHAEEQRLDRGLAVDLVLPDMPIPPLSAKVMRKEVQRIWTREGVTIEWRTSEGQVPSDARSITFTVIDDRNRPMRTPAIYVVGDYLANEERIRISLFAAARAAADATSTPRLRRDPFAYPLALGYVLARTIAHEIGHALLGPGHTESGLMSARFSPAALADRDSPFFRLDTVSARHLAELTRGTHLQVRAPSHAIPAQTSSLLPSGGH